MLNKKTKIAYLGPQGSFSHLAATELYPDNNCEYISVTTIEDVFDDVNNDICEFGIVPIENSNAGSVSFTLDAFFNEKYKINITKEHYVKIDFQFAGNSKTEIKKIFAHPMAIAQCRLWLKNNFPNTSVDEISSNSQAAILAQKNHDTAAITTTPAANLNNLKILEKNIQDYTNNVTRFHVITKEKTEATGNDKTSLLFTLKHEPGTLYDSLGALARREINMTRIESRIMKAGNWEYYFFVDIEGHEKDKNISEALQDMKKYCTSLKNLGSYPRGVAPWG